MNDIRVLRVQFINLSRLIVSLQYPFNEHLFPSHSMSSFWNVHFQHISRSTTVDCLPRSTINIWCYLMSILQHECFFLTKCYCITKKNHNGVLHAVWVERQPLWQTPGVSSGCPRSCPHYWNPHVNNSIALALVPQSNRKTVPPLRLC